MVNTGSAAPAPAQPNLDYSDASSPRATGFSIEPARKKRGRPRKYSPDGNIALGLSPTPVTPISSGVPPTDSGSGGGGGDTEGPSSENPSKKARGRPPGSGKKQLDALGIYILMSLLVVIDMYWFEIKNYLFGFLELFSYNSVPGASDSLCLTGAAGVGFTPHVITVNVGEVKFVQFVFKFSFW